VPGKNWYSIKVIKGNYGGLKPFPVAVGKKKRRLQMKGISRLFGIVAVATILSLLVVALPASPALAYERLNLDPDKGEIGDRIDVTGYGFKKSIDPNYYMVYIFLSPEDAEVDVDNIDQLDTYHKVKTKSTDEYGEFSTYFYVPSRLTYGDVDEDVHGGTYYVYTAYSLTGEIKSKDEFTVIAAEIAVDPDKGTVGTEVDIDGTDFNGKEYITVDYDGDEIDIESGDDETDSSGDFSSSILIPESTAGKHTITVTDETGSTAEAEFTVEPQITVTPAKAAPGDTATVKGTGFGKDAAVTIEFDGSEVVSVDTGEYGSFSVGFKVPVKSPGTYQIKAEDDDRNKDSENFTVASGINLSLTSGNVGSEVTVNGAGFTPNSTVTITYAPESTPVATPAADANGRFSATFTAPKSQHGRHTITASDGTNSVTTTFTMESTPPQVPQPKLPLDGTKAESKAYFDWEDVTDPSGVTYTLQIATDEGFTEGSIVLEKTDIADSEYTLTKEEKLKSTKKEAPYYWRIRAVDGAENASGWTSPGSFYIGFTFELTGWILYTLMGVAGILLLAIGYLVGRRTSYY
jgi:archaellum component FlaG (FlaF/FlaG flagellin family)